MPSPDNQKKYERTLDGLRDSLFDELEDLREGTSGPHEAIAFSKLASQIVATCDVEIRRQQVIVQARALRIREHELKLAPPTRADLLIEHSGDE